VIPVLSLGATRRFLIKPDRGGRSTVITTHGGDLVVMGGRCQKDYKHSVPKQRALRLSSRAVSPGTAALQASRTYLQRPANLQPGITSDTSGA